MWNGLMRPASKRPASSPLVEVIKAEYHACCRCGYSKVDGKPISRARYRIAVKSGSIYLCAHHFRKHSAHILEHAYVATEVAQ